MATTYTNYFNTYFNAPAAGTNVTITNKLALGADSINAAAIAINGTAVVAGGCAAVGAPTANILLMDNGSGCAADTTGGAIFNALLSRANHGAGNHHERIAGAQQYNRFHQRREGAG